jgi:biotin synthase
MRISSGSAARLGLISEKQLVAPTTCYFQAGQSCTAGCSYCSPENLSRISWPRVDNAAIVLNDIDTHFKRACIQCIGKSLGEAIIMARNIRLPVSISYRFQDLEEVRQTLAVADKACIPVDVVNTAAHRLYRKGDLEKTLALIRNSAAKHEDRIATHLIVGLGETCEEIEEFLKAMKAIKVTVALFAFTQAGSLKGRPVPDMAYYRKIQALHYKISTGSSEIKPEAFETSGCPGCNRPFYNERAKGPWYNYPRPLTREEYNACMALAR